MLIQTAIAKARVEAFDERILRWLNAKINRQSGAGLPAERFAAGRKICEANAPLQIVRVERLASYLSHCFLNILCHS